MFIEWMKENGVALLVSGVAICATWYETKADITVLEYKLNALTVEQSKDSTGVVTLLNHDATQEQRISQLEERQSELKPLIAELNGTLVNLNTTLVIAQKDNESNRSDLTRIQNQQTQLISDVQDIKLKLK